MWTKSLAACLGVAAFVPSPVPAQVPSPAATDRPAVVEKGGSRFAAHPPDGLMRVSRLVGTTIVSTNNESVGDVNDVILSREGRIAGVVIGVGGFLGIGEKDVAVSFEVLEQASSGPTGEGASITGSAGIRNDPQAAADAPPASAATDSGLPDRLVLRMTRADLEAAPAFGSGHSPASSGDAPKP